MFWMLLVYVIASGSFQGQPAITPSFHGASYSTKEDCEAAARTVSSYSSSGLDDISKVGMFMVCAPVNPPPPPPVVKAEAVPPPQQQPAFPLYPPPPKRNGH
jgi:hypothetical protein